MYTFEIWLIRQECVQFNEFWLFLTEQVFTLPLQCYKKSNQGAQEFAHKSAKRAHPWVK